MRQTGVSTTERNYPFFVVEAIKNVKIMTYVEVTIKRSMLGLL